MRRNENRDRQLIRPKPVETATPTSTAKFCRTVCTLDLILFVSTLLCVVALIRIESSHLNNPEHRPSLFVFGTISSTREMRAEFSELWPAGSDQLSRCYEVRERKRDGLVSKFLFAGLFLAFKLLHGFFAVRFIYNRIVDRNLKQ